MPAIPGVTLYFQPVQDIQISTRTSRAQYQYTLVASDANDVATWSAKLTEKLRNSPVLREVVNEAQEGGLRAFVNVDREMASRLGISMQSVNDALNDAFGQRQISTIYAQSNQYRVVLEAMPQYQGDASALTKLYVPASGGAQVPLSAIAKIERRTAPLAINHQDQFPSVTLSFNLAAGASLSDAVHAISSASDEIGMPTSVTGSYSGDADEFTRSLAGQPWLILAAVITIYIVLGVLYESFVHPFTILTTLPSAGIGALLALMYCGMDLSMVALIGIILLMGIVKKNAIMMIDFALEAERTQGMSPRDSIVQACLLRFRPIMMTTLAALFGRAAAGARGRHRLGAAQSARRHHHRRPAAEPAADALHHAGDLPRHGAGAGAAGTRLQRRDPRARRGRQTFGSRRSEAMNFSRPCIERPIGTMLLAMGLMLLGLVAYRFLPVASLPSVEFPTIRVNASLPGADPETMAARVAAPLERRLGEIAGVTEMTSTNSLGSTRIAIQFALNRDIEGAAQDVQAAINAAAADLPADMPSLPNFRKSNPAAAPILILALTSKSIAPSDMYDAADTVIAQRISQVDGVAEVTVAGAEQPAIRVRVNPMQLASMGMSIEDVRTAITNANAVAPLGIIDGDQHVIGAGDQRPAAHGRGLPEHRHQVGERQRRAPVGRGQRRAGNAQLALGRQLQRAAGHPADHRQERRRQRHRHGRSHPRADPGDQALDPGRHGHLHPVRSHHHAARQHLRHAADARAFPSCW